MVDLKLDPLNANDIEFVDDDFGLTSDGDAIRQHVLIRLKFFQGEYFLNQNEGVPYYQQILIKNPRLSVIRALLQETILETPGISSISDFELSLNTSSRLLEVSFTATTDLGEILDFSEEFLIGDVQGQTT